MTALGAETARRSELDPAVAAARARAHWTPWVVLVAALALTAVAAGAMWLGAARDDATRFENRVQAATDRVHARMEIYVALLRAGAAMFAAHDVSVGEWHAYAQRLELASRYPGILGIGFTRRVHADSLDRLQRDMRRAGVAGFRVWPDTARAEYHTIVFLEPLNARNAAAIGYDMFTNPVRRAAMELARDAGQAAMSGRVTLVQEIEGPVQAGFLIYAPVYRGGVVPESVEQRRRDLHGFVYAPFRAGDLFSGIFGSERDPRVSFAVYDGAPADTTLLYDTHPHTHWRDERPSLTKLAGIEVAGRRWTLQFAPTDAFTVTSTRLSVPLIGIAGAVISLVLFGLSRAQNSARQDAQRANRAKSQFLATMSHELRTPLNAIAGYVDLLELGIRGPLTEAQRADLARIKAAHFRLLGLVNDVLNFAKLEAGRVSFRASPTSVLACVHAVEELVMPLAQARGVQYARADRPDAEAIADAEKVQQILLNLLSNAFKFTNAGGHVSVDWTVREGRVHIDVRDTGVGIPPEHLRHIFDPFVQLDADLTRANEGSGLGLAISRELAHGMQGELTARSTPGRGSVFTLVLPSA